MAKYWIRNRGRVQGPFNKERIQGLLRRGRFNRHYHVSVDRKEWLPADEFPELFNERRRGREDDDDDDAPFNSGGSPFDDDEDDYEPAPRKSKGRKSPSRKPVAAFGEEDDEYDEDDEEWEDDEDWEDDDKEGGGLTGWIEANVKVIAGLLGIAVLGALVWLLFFRESFVQDTEDLKTLTDVHMRVVSAQTMGMPANEWVGMQEEVINQLGPMVTRLESGASTQDRVKQELLFLARDDIPKMLKELPKGLTKSQERAQTRMKRVKHMIEKQIRYDDGTIVGPAGSGGSGNPMMPSGGTTGTGVGNVNSGGTTGQNEGGQLSDQPGSGGATSPGNGTTPSGQNSSGKSTPPGF